jgi:signal transduction histidine kinase
LLNHVITNERGCCASATGSAAADRSQPEIRRSCSFRCWAPRRRWSRSAQPSRWSAPKAERRVARREQAVESDRAMQLEEAVERPNRRTRAGQYCAAQRNDRARGAEAQLRQAQKMEAVGQLTGGIAHDFNNMLAVVVGGLELAQRSPEKASRHLANALDGANRAADLTRRLLTFARSEPARPEITRSTSASSGFSELIERTIGDRIALTLDLQAEGPCLLGRPATV